MQTPSDTAIEQALKGIKKLRLFPPAAQRILREANNPAANLRSLERAVKLDPILTARVLKIANSAFYGAPNRIATLGQALGVMGFQPARDMAVALAVGSLQGPSQRGNRELWEHALKNASAARLLSRYVRGADSNALFIAGLLHDIGRALLFELEPKKYQTMSQQFKTDYKMLVKAERFAFKFDHAILGAKCLGLWDLPEQVIQVIQFHHDFDYAKDEVPANIRTGALLVQISEHLVEGHQSGLTGERLATHTKAHEVFHQVGISDQSLEVAVDLVAEEFRALSAVG